MAPSPHSTSREAVSYLDADSLARTPVSAPFSWRSPVPSFLPPAAAPEFRGRLPAILGSSPAPPSLPGKAAVGSKLRPASLSRAGRFDDSPSHDFLRSSPAIRRKLQPRAVSATFAWPT